MPTTRPKIAASPAEAIARTVRRDVDRPRELGYLITTVKVPKGGYRLATPHGRPMPMYCLLH